MTTPVERFRAARRDPSLVVLEGFHALKHALRFGADLVETVSVDPDAVRALAEDLAPDIASRVQPAAVDESAFAALAPIPPRTGVVAIARRPSVEVEALAAAAGPLVLLESPRRAGNVGAAIRVAAAADAAGVLVVGALDPWDPAAVRGAAGLQFALPVARVDELPDTGRPLVALHPGGDDILAAEVPADPVLAFGTEREGLSGALLDRADLRLRIPMRAGVSSLNLATAVAVALYGVR